MVVFKCLRSNQGITPLISEDASLVAHYVAYLATTPVGADRAHIAELEAVAAVGCIKGSSAS